MDSFEDSDDSLYVSEDYLQQALQSTEPIPFVRRQAYILIVGDSGTGKSLLARSFTRHPRTAAKRYHNLVINQENPRHKRKISDSIGLHFFCVPFRSGDDDCLHHEPLNQHPFSVIIYLFDLNRRDTFRNVFSKWYPEITDYLGVHRLPRTILVGNKTDLRSLNSYQYFSDPVSTNEGGARAIEVDAKDYIEVCALAGLNTGDVLLKILAILDIAWTPDF